MDVILGWTVVVLRSCGKEDEVGFILAIPCIPENGACESPGEGRGVWPGVMANGVGAKKFGQG
jgi:hypothetical protein